MRRWLLIGDDGSSFVYQLAQLCSDLTGEFIGEDFIRSGCWGKRLEYLRIPIQLPTSRSRTGCSSRGGCHAHDHFAFGATVPDVGKCIQRRLEREDSIDDRTDRTGIDECSYLTQLVSTRLSQKETNRSPHVASHCV